MKMATRLDRFPAALALLLALLLALQAHTEGRPPAAARHRPATLF